MQIPVSFHTALKLAELLTFLDSGATECFISQRFIDTHKLGTRLMTTPQKLQNADGSPNTGGGLTHFTELEVFTGENPHVLCFYIANMGPDNLVLGYPWFAATNAQPDWATGMLPALVTIHTRGAASGKPMRSVQVAGMRTTIRNAPLLNKGDELYIRILHTDRLAKTTVAQQLAEQATDKTIRSWDQIVPPQYHQHERVFSEVTAHRFPTSQDWDHAIDLKPDAPTTLDCKVYPLSPAEDIALQTFLSENLDRGYICQSKSPYVFPFFFIKKKNGDLQPVQDYRKLNAFTVRNTAPLLVTTFPLFATIYTLFTIGPCSEPLFPFRSSFSQLLESFATSPSLPFPHSSIFTCQRSFLHSYLGPLTHLCLPPYLHYLVRYSDSLRQAFLRPFLYLTLASTMTKP